jgi:cellulose synthase/poly-beta-1,6-N-acetylglucosamine synthase-like glycosyltransferase
VNQPLPIVTVIIAAPPAMTEVRAVAAARKLDYPADRLEIIVARGRQPSVQRNTALRAARGEWIYFLDDDALPPPDNLQRAQKNISQPQVAMLGGPNLCPPDAPFLEQVFAVVLASWLAFGPSRARYAMVGRERDTGEKELILCNTLARRDALLALGGFNEALYPNEENALMDEMQKRGMRLVYDPEFFVHRRPRRTLRAFLKMLRTYGRGRAEQFRLHPTPGSALNFVPPLFCLYLALLAALEIFGGDKIFPVLKSAAALPLGFYLLAVVGQTLVSIFSAGFIRAVTALPLLVASHVFYGLGFWRGLFTKLNTGAGQPRTEVVLEKITP